LLAQQACAYVGVFSTPEDDFVRVLGLLRDRWAPQRGAPAWHQGRRTGSITGVLVVGGLHGLQNHVEVVAFRSLKGGAPCSSSGACTTAAGRSAAGSSRTRRRPKAPPAKRPAPWPTSRQPPRTGRTGRAYRDITHTSWCQSLGWPGLWIARFWLRIFSITWARL
jgi:hypothetical protein